MAAFSGEDTWKGGLFYSGGNVTMGSHPRKQGEKT
jgi:hypothetical protein